jgi:hypothetical protein
MLLQFANGKNWYCVLYSNFTLQNNHDCPIYSFGAVSSSSFSASTYDIRWVYNIHSLFTAIYSGISIYRETSVFSSNSCMGYKRCDDVSGFERVNFPSVSKIKIPSKYGGLFQNFIPVSLLHQY